MRYNIFRLLVAVSLTVAVAYAEETHHTNPQSNTQNTMNEVPFNMQSTGGNNSMNGMNTDLMIQAHTQMAEAYKMMAQAQIMMAQSIGNGQTPQQQIPLSSQKDATMYPQGGTMMPQNNNVMPQGNDGMMSQ